MAEISVYAFTDFRKFLQACFASRKSRQPSLSRGRFSVQMGFGSANYAGLIIDGKRNLTIERLHKVARALGMTFEETRYFECLTLYNQSTSAEERSFYKRSFMNLRRRRPPSTARFPVEKLFAQPYYPVVLMAFERSSLPNALEKLTKMLPFNEERILRILKDLLQSELLAEKEGVFYLNYSHQIFHDKKSASSRHQNFLLSQLELSQRICKKSYSKGAKFYAHTFSLAQDDFDYYNERLRSLLSEITARSDQSPPDEVAQLNMQLFRITKDCF